MPSQIDPTVPISGSTPGPTTASIRANFQYAHDEITALQAQGPGGSVTAARLVGNPTGAAAAASEISLGTNLSFAGSVLNAAGGGSGPVSLTGDVTGSGTGTIPATVVRLQGRALAATPPTDTQVLAWNAGASQWQPTAPAAGGSGGISTVTAGTGLTGGGSTPTVTLSLATPAVPIAGGTMTGLLVLSGNPIAANGAATKGYVDAAVLDAAGGGGGPVSLTGDVTGSGTGTIPASVVRLQGRALAATPPADTQVLAWNAGASQWQPTAPATGGTGGGGISDAVSDGTSYSRQDANWTNTPAFLGATITGTAPGQLVINRNTAPLSAPIGNTALWINWADGAAIPNVLLDYHSGGGAGAPQIIFRNSGGSGTTPAPSPIGTYIGALNFRGHDTDWTANVAGIRCIASEDFTPDHHGNRLEFSSTPPGTSVIQTEAVMGPGLTVGAPTPPASGMLAGDINGQRVMVNGIEVAAGGGISDAVSDGTSYSRQNAVWTNTPNFRGAIITGVAPGSLAINRNTAPLPTPPVGAVGLWANFNDGEQGFVVLDTHATNASFQLRRADGTGAAPTPVALGETLGAIGWFGHGETGYGSASARIAAVALEDYSDGAQGTHLLFQVSPVGSTTVALEASLGSGLTVGAPAAPASAMQTGDLNVSGRIMINGVEIGLASSSRYIASVIYGAVFKYNSQYPTKYVAADVWTTTWADDDGNYTLNDDSFGWEGAPPGSNVAVSRFSDYSLSLTGSIVNTMQPWGGLGVLGADECTYKGNGLISVAGTLYMAVSRHHYGDTAGIGVAAKQSAGNAQIIASTDHGVNWTPLPPATAEGYAAPMFPGFEFGAPFFIQYGKDYIGQTVDNSADFLYAISNDGWWNNGSSMYLARVRLTDLPNLVGSDWSYYQGGDGMLDASWGARATAVSILDNPLKLSMAAVQYLPAFGVYVMVQWWYLSIVNNVLYNAGQTQWDFYYAPHPWGPWTMLTGASKVWNTSPGAGLYNPCIIPQSLAPDGGRTAMIAAAGDHTSQDPATGDYTLTLVPLTLSDQLPSLPPPPPAVVTQPAVTGTPAVGQTLTCSTGTWSAAPTSYAYQWRRGGANIGTNASTYMIVAADQGYNLDCVVTATNAVGSTAAPPSNAIAIPAALGAPANTTLPAVTGTAATGSTLTCSQGAWSNSPTSFAYQWRRDGTTNIGAAVSTYVVATADEGHSLTCVVTATNAAGSTPAISNAIAVAGASATWNPAAKAAGIILLNGNATVSNTVNAYQYPGALSLGTTHSTGRVYFEGTTNPVTFAVDSVLIELGIGNAAANINAYMGSDNNSIGCYTSAMNDCNVVFNNTNNPASACFMTHGNAYTIGVAIDFDSKEFWCSIDGATWNNGGGASPGGAGGVSFAAIGVGPYMIFGGVGGDGTAANQITLNTIAPFVRAVPSGFAAWN
jgi:hypothetical protein